MDPMDSITFEKIVDTTIQKCKDTLRDRQMEYADGCDVLHNFKVSAALQQCTMEQALFGYLTKHLVSLAGMCESGEVYPREVWDEKIVDSINYLLILRAIVEESNDRVRTRLVSGAEW